MEIEGKQENEEQDEVFGLGLASGITSGAAAITKKIMSSKQMSKVKVAIEVDSAATSELLSELETVKKDERVTKVAGLAFTVGGDISFFIKILIYEIFQALPLVRRVFLML